MGGIGALGLTLPSLLHAEKNLGSPLQLVEGIQLKHCFRKYMDSTLSNSKQLV